MELQELPRSKLNQRLTRDVEAGREVAIEIVKQPKIRFGHDFTTMKCPYCRAKMTTRMEVRTKIWTHLSAAILCLLCMWPCIPLVYCTKSCLTLKHYCSECNQYLGESGFLPFLRWNRRSD